MGTVGDGCGSSGGAIGGCSWSTKRSITDRHAGSVQVFQGSESEWQQLVDAVLDFVLNTFHEAGTSESISSDGLSSKVGAHQDTSDGLGRFDFE
jgi:hypothetical protein